MKLYYAPGACSLSPHIVALEEGLKLDYEKVDLKEHKTESGKDYYAINPKGYVPALQLDDGSILTEGPAIVQYFADLKPASHLAPRCGTPERYRLMEWLNFITAELHKNFGGLFSDKSTDEMKKSALTKITARLTYVNAALADQDYLMGEHFTVADAYLFVMTNWARKMNIALPPHVADFRARVLARPHVKQALQAEGLSLI